MGRKHGIRARWGAPRLFRGSMIGSAMRLPSTDVRASGYATAAAIFFRVRQVVIVINAGNKHLAG
jgi:hypothetical protein